MYNQGHEKIRGLHALPRRQVVQNNYQGHMLQVVLIFPNRLNPSNANANQTLFGQQIEENPCQNVSTLQHQLDIVAHQIQQFVYPYAISFQKQYASMKIIASTLELIGNDIKSYVDFSYISNPLLYIEAHHILNNLQAWMDSYPSHKSRSFLLVSQNVRGIDALVGTSSFNKSSNISKDLLLHPLRTLICINLTKKFNEANLVQPGYNGFRA